MQPFLKWPGGKRWFTSNHQDLLPRKFNRYIEPFLGSGAVFFSMKPEKALLGDLNGDLIQVYRGIKKDWKQVLELLKEHQRKHSESYYYKVREMQTRTLAEGAARLIYLNRTCFNGIYRVNREGRFNVPKGNRDSVVFDTDNFQEVARLLAGTELYVADFELLIDKAGKNDFIFADPPYTVRHNNNGFIKYNEMLFSWSDQERLAEALGRARRRGAKIVATNANHQSVAELYEKSGFELKSLSRYSSISADPEKRRQFEELLILS